MKVVVLGGGPGGYVCAIRLAQLGAQVTLVEKKRMGGTCLNSGCIPTKSLLHGAEILRTVQEEGPKWGIESGTPAVSWQKVLKQKEQVVNRLVGGVEGLMAANKIKVISGEGKFLDAKTILCGEEKISFDSCVVAVGAESKIPPIPGADLKGVVTSKEALSLDEIPDELCIVGGGVIGCELAGVYAAFGTKVTILEALPDLLMNLDRQTVNVLKKSFDRQGIKYHVGTDVDKIEEDGGKLKVYFTGGMVPAEKVLLATGRGPVLSGLRLERAGVKTEKGFIWVDRGSMETSTGGIYAIGDCIGGIQLAHVASAEGMAAAESIMGMTPEVCLDVVPSGVYTVPELAGVGLTEEQAINRGHKVKVGEFPMMANGKALITGGGEGVVRIIANERNGEILGVHMAGPRATDIIAEAALAIRLEATVDELITTIHAHPTVSEAVAEAAHAVYGLALHMPPGK